MNLVSSLLLVLLLSSCATTARLDLNTLDNNVFQVSDFTLMVREDIDKAEDGQFMKELLPQVLPVIKESLEENYNVQIKDDILLSLIEDGSIEIKKEQFDIGVIINNYSWTSGNEYDQAASITVSFGPDENGNIPVFIDLIKINSENPDKPYLMNLELSINSKGK